MSVRAAPPGAVTEKVTSFRQGIGFEAFATVVGEQFEDDGTAGHVVSAGVMLTGDQAEDGTVGSVTEYVAPGVLTLAFGGAGCDAH